MKVLYVTSLPLENTSGAQNHVMKIYNGLEKQGFKMSLVAPLKYEMGISGAIKRKIEMVSLSRDAIKVFKPDIIYCRYEGADILSIREFVRHRVPFVLEMNTKTIPELWATRRYLPMMVSLVTEPWIFSKASGIAAVSHEIYNYTVRSCKRGNYFLLAKNGVDTEEYCFKNYNPSIRKLYNTPLEVPLLIMIGSISPWHGVDLLLHALSNKQLNNYHLWVIGNINYPLLKNKGYLQEVLRRVRLIPWQPARELNKLLSAGDIGISAISLYRKQLKEAQSLKTRVYLATGVPVFLGHKDPVICGDYPFIMEGSYACIEELSNKIRYFYESIAKNRDELRKLAREYAEKNLTWEVASEETANFLLKVHENKF